MPDYVRNCRQCGTAFSATWGSARICSDECRRERALQKTRDWRQHIATVKGAAQATPCIDCAEQTRGLRCRTCSIRSSSTLARQCADCGKTATGRRCRSCYAESKRIYGTDHNKGRRAFRELIVGLPKTRRRALLHKWQRQGRTCTFCPNPCESVDHVIPLARGGTNYEGNLTPACIRCNSSRGARTVMEWRMGRTEFKNRATWVMRAA